MVQAGFTWAPVLMRRKSFTLRYRLDVIPVNLLQDRFYAPPGVAPAPGRHWIYGGGLSPAGVQMEFHNHTRLTPFGEVVGGFLYFRQPVLAYDETQFQFTIAPGLGVRIAMTPRTALIFGYRYHHLSNANIYKSNPGLDSQIVYAGLAIF